MLMICVSSADVVTGAGDEMRCAGAEERCPGRRLKMTVLSLSSAFAGDGCSAGGMTVEATDRGLGTTAWTLETAGPALRPAARRERDNPSVTKVMTNAAA